MKYRTERWMGWLLGLLVWVAATGCSTSLEEASGDAAATSREARLLGAQRYLADSEVDRAQGVYAELLTNDPKDGEAAAGKAMCDLLLLPGSNAAGRLATGYLAADGPIDANALLYEEGGYFYLASRGVPWEDSGEYVGMKTLLAERLPWSKEHLSDLHAFTRLLDEPFDKAAGELVAIADGLAQVEREIEIALGDERFETLTIPGEVFDQPDLDLVVGKSDLAVISSAVGAARGVLYFTAAYRHDWTPSEATVEGDPSHVIEHAVSYLDPRLLREVARPAELDSARGAFDAAIVDLRESIKAAESAPTGTVVSWGNLPESDVQRLLEVLSALRDALHAPTDIPYTEPATTLDLSSFFEGGRVLPAENASGDPVNWFTAGDSGGGTVADTALQRFFVDGVFEPTFQVGSDPPPMLQLRSSSPEDLPATVGGEFSRDVEESF